MEINESLKTYFKKIGKNIRKLRESENITISELSEKTRIRKIYLQKIENGVAYRVSIEHHLLKIADALKIRISDIFDFE